MTANLQKILVLSLMISGLTALPGGLAHANAPAPVHGEFMKPLEQITLTEKTVKKVVQVLPKLIALTKNYKGTHSAGANKKQPVKNVKYNAFTIALELLSGEHGFKDTHTMQRTVETTMLTAGFLTTGKTLKQVRQQIANTQKKVEANPKLTAKQKSSLLRRMHIQISMVVPSPENIKVVKPFFQQIYAITSKK